MSDTVNVYEVSFYTSTGTLVQGTFAVDYTLPDTNNLGNPTVVSGSVYFKTTANAAHNNVVENISPSNVTQSIVQIPLGLTNTFQLQIQSATPTRIPRYYTYNIKTRTWMGR